MSYALITLAAVYLLWVHYVAVMRLKMVRDAGQLTASMKAFGYPTLVFGWALDLVVNVAVGTLIFAELPHELTVSARLTRHSQHGSGWRQRLALAVRTALLDNIDPDGIHGGA